MKTIKILFFILALTVLTACGGGGSSSGGSLQKVATFCVIEVVVSESNLGIPIETRSYTNNCGFTVNLAIHSTVVATINTRVTLAVNEVHTESILLEAHFACRAPSVPARSGSVGNYENSCEG
jgi:hypothetical protein